MQQRYEKIRCNSCRIKKSNYLCNPFQKGRRTGAVVQSVRISACHAGGREFESRPHRREPLTQVRGSFFAVQRLGERPRIPRGVSAQADGGMVSPAAAVATTGSASDSNLRRCKEEWFRLQTVVATPDLHRFLISGPDLGIDARISPETTQSLHRFLISGLDLGIDARISQELSQSLQRFSISGPDLRIDARISPELAQWLHRFLISGPDLGIDARKPAEDAVFQHLLTSVVCRASNKRKLLLVIFLKIP